MKNGEEIDHNGTIRWFKDNKYHREDGPAIIYEDGTTIWYKHGKFHREDGPAATSPRGVVEFYLNGVLYPTIFEYAVASGWDDKKLAVYLLIK